MGRRVLREGNLRAAVDREGGVEFTEAGWLGQSLILTPGQVPDLRRLLAKVERASVERQPGMSGADADPKQKRCSQCGKSFTSRACGPTHAAIRAARERQPVTKTPSAPGVQRGGKR